MAASKQRRRRPPLTRTLPAHRFGTGTPSTLNTFLRGLPSRWVAANEGFDCWSPLDIVGHLVIGERTDWMPRAKRILEHGEAIPFDLFDRFAQGKECRGKSLEELLDEFAALRP
jgi:hypothetical protein